MCLARFGGPNERKLVEEATNYEIGRVVELGAGRNQSRRVAGQPAPRADRLECGPKWAHKQVARDVRGLRGRDRRRRNIGPAGWPTWPSCKCVLPDKKRRVWPTNRRRLIVQLEPMERRRGNNDVAFQFCTRKRPKPKSSLARATRVRPCH